ncbi:hypothetical protein CN230_26935 [Sinorhizobium meliloti]|nr:hypothetical protein CN230_26935 [Sinorhizobium meliloti]
MVASKHDHVGRAIPTVSNHSIHMHGFDFEVTCTDGGRD